MQKCNIIFDPLRSMYDMSLGDQKHFWEGGTNCNFASLTPFPACLEKLNDLLGALGSKYKSIEELVSDVLADKKGYKFRITRLSINSSRSADTNGGSIVLNSSVDLAGHDIDSLHEIFHAANIRNNYSHRQIAEAIAKIEGLDISKYDVWKGNKEIGGGFLNSFIQQYCTDAGSKSWTEWLTRFK